VDPELWQCLHDATLVQIVGRVPGELCLNVRIRYLRERFPDPGEGFELLLRGCSHFVYEPYEGSPTTDLPEIAALELWVIGAEAGSPMQVACSTGTLLVKYESASIKLDTGLDVSLAELEDATQSYWREWSERYRTAP
jgi:hypothetical protein